MNIIRPERLGQISVLPFRPNRFITLAVENKPQNKLFLDMLSFHGISVNLSNNCMNQILIPNWGNDLQQSKKARIGIYGFVV